MIAALNDAQETITLDGAELYYLSAVAGGEMLLGVADPFPGWLTEEIRDALETARGNLATRGLIELLADDRITLHPGLAATLPAITAPVATLFVSVSDRGHDDERTWFIGDEQVVEVHTGEDGTYRLGPLPDTSDLAARLGALWEIDGQEAPPGTPGSLREADLTRARRLVAEGKPAEAREVLDEGGLSTETAASLVESLAAPDRSGSLAAVSRGATVWDAGGVAVLMSANGLWAMQARQRGEETWVDVTPCDAVTLMAMAERVAARFAEGVLRG